MKTFKAGITITVRSGGIDQEDRYSRKDSSGDIGVMIVGQASGTTAQRGCLWLKSIE